MFFLPRNLNNQKYVKINHTQALCTSFFLSNKTAKNIGKFLALRPYFGIFLHTFSVHIFGTHFWYTFLVHIFGAHFQCTFSVYIFGTHFWYTFSVHIFGTHFRYTFSVHIFGIHFWYTFWVHLFGTLSVHIFSTYIQQLLYLIILIWFFNFFQVSIVVTLWVTHSIVYFFSI